MRLILTVERYAPAIGGAERVVQRLAEGLSARGHEVHVLTGGARADLELGGVQVHRMPLRGNEVVGLRGEIAAPLALIEQIGPELVFNYAAQTWTTDICFGLLARAERPAMVLAPCGFSRLDSRLYAGYYSALPARLRSYDALILHSRLYQDWDFCARAGAEPMLVIPNGADPPAERVRRPGPPAQVHVVTVGSHVRSKGHAAFARAIGRLSHRHDLHGTIVAPPRKYLGALRGCAAACRLRARASRGRLSVIDGSVPGASAEAIASADLFLLTSTIECAPLVILEAMAAGVPWVSYDVGNVSELPGGIVAAETQGALEQAAAAVLDRKHPALGAEGHAAWQANHRWETIVTQYERAFESVSARRPVLPASG